MLIHTHTPESLLYGIGQGMGNSLAVWALLSSTMSSLYSSHAHGAHFYDLSKLLHSQVDIVGYIHDTSSSINMFLDPKLHEPEYYINLATHDAQLWNNILSLSGSALQAAKCSYHLLYFNFTSGSIPYVWGGSHFSNATNQIQPSYLLHSIAEPYHLHIPQNIRCPQGAHRSSHKAD